eukprot:PITA_31626
MMRNHEALGRPPLFDGTNFGFWKERMTYYLISLGPEVWHFIQNECQIPPTLPIDQDERKAYIANAKALNSITSGITDFEFTRVMNCNSAKEMWDKLIGLYGGDSKFKKAKLQTHRRKFESLKMEDEEDIATYFLQVAEVVNSLKGLGKNIEKSTIVQKVLRCLPDRFDSKISTIEESKDLDTLKMDELHGILTAYEIRKGGPSSKYEAFKASKSKKGKERNDCSDDSDVESKLTQFVRNMKKGSKLKGNSKRRVYKKKGTNKKNFFSKQDESDEDEFVVIKRKSDEESDHDESQETLFMAFTIEDDSRLEGNVDELLISAIEENEKLRNKIVPLKVENEETRIREDLLETKLKEKEETCEEREAEIVSLRKELEQVKKGWKSSQILETILKIQKPQHDESGIGFKGESSSTKNSAKSYVDALSSNPKEEKVCHQRRILDPKNEERITPNKNVDSNHGYYNKYKPVFHQRPSQIQRMKRE